MAQIQHLYKSISDMSTEELTAHFLALRANRRIRPTKTQRKKNSNAKAKRTSHAKKNLSQKDAFTIINNMSEEQKQALAKKLMEKK